MRICLLTHQWPGVRMGGIGVYTCNCARGLARAGHRVHVVTLRLPGDVPRDLGSAVTVHELEHPGAAETPNARMPGPLGGETLHLMSMRKAMAREVDRIRRQHGLDIVEAPEYEALGGQIARGALPLVTQLHSGAAIARAVGNAPWNAHQAMREALELETIAASDAICAPSRVVIQDTQRAYEWSGATGDAEVIPLPFDIEAGAVFHESPKDAPVLYVGRIEWLKGAHLLAQAAAVFLREHPEAHLRIVGPDTMTSPPGQGESGGQSMAAWMRRHWDEQIAARISFTGELTQRQVDEEMRGAAFVVVPSLRESCSFVCCAALAAGRPVVVSSDIGATEVVGDAGVCFRRGDAGELAAAVGRLWNDEPMRHGLSRRAWDRARSVLSADAAIARRVAFYDRVVARRWAEGTRPFEERLAAMPAVYRERVNLANRLAVGFTENLPELMRSAQLEGDLSTPGMRLVDALARVGEAGIPFRLYGAGRHTARLLMEQQRWEERGHRVVGLIDDHPRFAADPQCYGLPVMSVRAAESTLQPGDVVVLSTDAFEEQFWRQTSGLRKRGVTVVRLYGGP